MSEEDFFPDSLLNSFSSRKKPSSSILEDKLSKEILPYEIEISSKNLGRSLSVDFLRITVLIINLLCYRSG